MKVAVLLSVALAVLVVSVASESEEIKPKERKTDPILTAGCVQKLKECRDDDSKKASECLKSLVECMKVFDFNHVLPAEIIKSHNSPIMATFKNCFGKLVVCHTNAQGAAEAVETCANEAMACVRQGKSEAEFFGILPPILKKVIRSYDVCKKDLGVAKCIQQHIKKVKKLQSKLEKKGAEVPNPENGEDVDDGTPLEESVPDGGVPGIPSFKMLATMFKKCFNKMVHCSNQDFSNASACLIDFKECMPEPPTNMAIVPATLKQFKGAAVVQCVNDFKSNYGNVEDANLLNIFISCVMSKKIGGLPQPMARHGYCYRHMMERPHSTEEEAELCLEHYSACLGPLYDSNGEKKGKKKEKGKGRGKNKGEKKNGHDKEKNHKKQKMNLEEVDHDDH